MHGSPVARAAIVLGALLLLLVPLRSFTVHREQAAAPTPVRETALTDVRLRIVATRAPFVFVVEHLGTVLWKGESEGESIEKTVRLAVPREGVDLTVQVEWKSPGLSAAKVVFENGGEISERSLWGEGNAEDVLTFP